MADNYLLLLALIVFVGIVCQWISWRIKFPSIIMLLVAGIIFGPVTGVLNPDKMFGDLLFPMVSLSVAVILFEGGLTLKLSDIKDIKRPLRNLLTVGVLITWVITTFAVYYILNFPWALALLFGALMTVTGPTVIKPLLSSIRPQSDIANILHWEGIILDVFGAILIVLVYQLIVSEFSGETLPITFGAMIATGILLGAAGAFLLAFLLKKHLLPYYLHHVVSLGLVLIIFAISNTIMHESGLIAVTLMGMILANTKGVDTDDILFFKESLSVMLISVLFVVLAARLQFSSFAEMGWGSLLVLAIILFVARPISVLISTYRSPLSIKARMLLSWIAPRGIVAAAISALFALKLEAAGYEQAELLVPLTFLIIIGTVLLQGLSARPLALWLNVTEPPSTGVLIVGANLVARALAHALVQQNVTTRLADSSWENVSAARLEGLDTYYGSVVSDHADRNMNFSGIGNLLAMSTNSSLNALTATRFKAEFSPAHTYYLKNSEEEQTGYDKAQHLSYSGRSLFYDDQNYSSLAALIRDGAQIKMTKLSEQFSLEDFQNQYDQRAILLFAFDDKDNLHFFTHDRKLKPSSQWRVGFLLPADLLKEPASKQSKERKKSSDDPEFTQA